MCTCGFYNRYEHVLRNFKTLLKKNCAVALDSYQLFANKILNMELNMILLMEFTSVHQTFTSELNSRFDECLAI